MIVDSYYFGSGHLAKECISCIHEALKDWSENWPGFKDEDTESNIYTV